MIISGENWNYRADLLAKKVADLISSGISSNKILILTLNSFKKDKLSSKINELLFSQSVKGMAQLNISTFSGISYNSINRNWICIEKFLNDGKNQILPTLCGLDAAQYFLQKIIKEEDFEDYFSKKNLMHQLLRRYKLVVENQLSESEIAEKSKILDETFSQEALNAINKYKILSSKNRFFDNLKQTASFLYLLNKGAIKDFDKIEYFFADDADEYSFAAFDFCKYMIKKAKESYVALDKFGCSRQGYLCAYSNVYNDLTNIFKQKEENLISTSKLKDDAQKLFENITQKTDNKLKNFETFSSSKRLEMLENAANKVNELLNSGVEINKIQIITPLADDNLLYSFNEFFRKSNIKIQLLTGNKKITEDIYVYSIITILELLSDNSEIIPNSFDIRILLNEILQIPIFECKEFVEYYIKHNNLPVQTNYQNSSYKNLLELLQDEDLKNSSLKTKFDRVFKEVIAPNIKENSDFEPINLLSKSINEFEKIKENFKNYENIILTEKDWLLHIKNSIVSQNPSKPAHIDQNALVISTAQKVVDFSLECDYQIWLDTTSPEWIKEDTGTIYNSWVFQKNFSNSEFTNELNKELTKEKTARLLRKLILCANKKIFTYSSIFDVSGRENFGELADFIEVESESSQEFKFVPRDDQKEILNYSQGKMAVPAVPGAGKTTVMLALLIELVKKGVSPTEIMVLTYMESAARNFLNRFKKITQSKNKLPHISTIHAFAFKILMENNNYALVNLPEDFSICDDIVKTAIIKEICSFNLPIGENLDDYSNLMLSAISKAKINLVSDEQIDNTAKNDTQMQEFKTIFNLYKNKLKELSLLDYDDLLIYAVKLLKTNKQTAEFYQEKFKYIIEDEAQDSSVIQQELIGILSKKHKNVIRCGDVNQAILGTFSNSDVEGFKKFINENKKVEMFRSQRCSKEIYEFANKIIDSAKAIPVMEDAFYDLKMQEVDGKNPKSINSLEYKMLDTSNDEKTFVINDIKEKLIDKTHLPSFAILLRTNRQVSTWASLLEKEGLQVICRGDSFKQKKVFTFILAAMELFVTPWNNKLVAKFYKEFCNIGKFKFDTDLYNYLEKSDRIIMEPDFIKSNFFSNKDFEVFWWEAFSIVESHTLDIQEIIILCANRYFEDVIDKSNAYLFSVLTSRYCNTLISDEKFKLNYIPEVIKYFKNLLSQRSIKGINFFAQEDEDATLNGFVQVMTIHKAKGAEFDYVYLPEFTDYNYPLNFSKCCEKINKRKKPLLTKLDKIITGKDTPISKTAKEEIHETLRLIYVAITRAKQGLKFSYSSKNEFNKNNISVQFIQQAL